VVDSFLIEVPDEDLEDLRRRLHTTRLGSPAAGEPWESGVDYQLLADLTAYWADGFEWRRQEQWLNSFPQYRADVDGQTVHFAHIRADRERYPDAVPIVMTHGWPYSFVELLGIADHLGDPLSHDGSLADAFDVVVPSLPGYGFSSSLAEGNFTGEAVARLWHRLMTDVLGYERYATYGEDVGAGVSDWLGASYPDSVIALFATHAAFPPDERTQDLTPAEEDFKKWLDEKWRTGRAYAHAQATRPDTLAVGLNDSPAGLLAWLLEKFHEWSGPDFAESWTDDDILTTVSLYWFTGTIGSSFLPYFHSRHDGPIPLVHVPVGVAVQWGERGFPREYAERTYTDLRTWTDLPKGGHFTAKQSPDLVAGAIRELFSALRG
jgi:pimeloyl-ACP methyl ester carboxylesterase